MGIILGDGPFLMVLGEGGEGVPMGKMDVLVWGGSTLGSSTPDHDFQKC